MELRQLEDFLAVVDAGGFSAAARTLGRTQQALSKSLAALESAVGTPLLERHSRQPTAAGRQLLPHARRALGELQSFRRNLPRHAGTEVPPLRLGASPTAAAGVVGEAVLSTVQRAPGLRVEIVTGLRTPLLTDLAAGRLDLCVCLDTEDGRFPGLQREDLGQQSYAILANANHPLSRRRTVPVRDLARCEWMLGTNLGEVQTAWAAIFTDAGLPAPEPSLTTSSLEFCRNALRSSLRLAVLPLALVEAELDRGELRVLAAPRCRWQRPLALYTRRGTRQDSPLVPALRRAAEREARWSAREASA